MSLLLRGGRAGLLVGGDILVRDGRVAAIAEVGTLGVPGTCGAVPTCTARRFCPAWWTDTSTSSSSPTTRVASMSRAPPLPGGRRGAAGRPAAVGRLPGGPRVRGRPVERDCPQAAARRAAPGGVPVAVISLDLHRSGRAAPPSSDGGWSQHRHPAGRAGDGCHRPAAVVGACGRGRRLDSLDVLAQMASRGVTALLDFEYGDNLTAWSGRPVPPRECTRRSGRSGSTTRSPREEAPGETLPDTGGRVHVGPFKVVADGSQHAHGVVRRAVRRPKRSRGARSVARGPRRARGTHGQGVGRRTAPCDPRDR